MTEKATKNVPAEKNAVKEVYPEAKNMSVTGTNPDNSREDKVRMLGISGIQEF